MARCCDGGSVGIGQHDGAEAKNMSLKGLRRMPFYIMYMLITDSHRGAPFCRALSSIEISEGNAKSQVEKLKRCYRTKKKHSTTTRRNEQTSLISQDVTTRKPRLEIIPKYRNKAADTATNRCEIHVRGFTVAFNRVSVFCIGMTSLMALSSLTTPPLVVIYTCIETLLSIAFKPAESGWGGGGKYANNFDSIFSSKKKDDNNDKEETAKKNDDQQSDQ
eukprot:scaffold18587_cov67-Skeletonema_dohrnii-CCMP3373.AAC.1